MMSSISLPTNRRTPFPATFGDVFQVGKEKDGQPTVNMPPGHFDGNDA